MLANGKIIISVSLFFLLFLGACSEFNEITIGSPSAIKVNGLNDNKLNIDLYLPIHNPNNLKFRITKIDMNIVLNDNYLGKITNADHVSIPASSDEKLRFNLDLEIKSVVKGLISIVNIVSQGRVEVKSDGYIRVRCGFVGKTIPVHNETSVNVQSKLPVIQFD